MKEILETIVKNLVEDKDAVEIKEIDKEKTIVFEVKVAEGDMGRIIGRQGRMARAIRTIVKATSNKEHKRATVEFVE